MIRDIERIEVVGEKRKKMRMEIGDDRNKRIKIIGKRELKKKKVNEIEKILKRILRVSRIMIGED